MALYLVTGVAGFIGSSIAQALLANGEQVRGIDNFITGKRDNLARLDKLDFIEGDVADAEDCAKACRGVTYIFHEAALPSVPRSLQNPLESNYNAVTATVQLLVAAKDAGVQRVVYAGSSSAYGETPVLPKREDMTPKPISPYAVAKLAGELYMSVFARCFELETVTIRYFNVFGPHQDAKSMYSGVLAKFITSMLKGQRPTIYGDGEQSRDFTYIDNVVHANLLASRAPAEEVSGKVFNVATGTRITLNQTYRLLQEMTGFKEEPIYGPARDGDIKHSLADISMAERHFGYKPEVSFEEGLRRTVEWYQQTAVSSDSR